MAPTSGSPSPSENSPTPAPTTRLVREARDGDAVRFRELYERIAPAVIAWADLRIPARLRAFMEPADIAQEVWVRALRRFADYDPARSRFRAWIFKIATYVLLEGLRRAAPRAEAPGAAAAAARVFDLEHVPEDATTVCRRVARDEALRSFLGRLGFLDPIEKRILLYHGLEGLTHEEVGRRLGLTTDAAMKRWQRLRQRLEQEGSLEDLLADS